MKRRSAAQNIWLKAMKMWSVFLRTLPRANCQFEQLSSQFFTQVDDRGLYEPGQKWLERRHIVGKVKGVVPYLGKVWRIDRLFIQSKYFRLTYSFTPTSFWSTSFMPSLLRYLFCEERNCLINPTWFLHFCVVLLFLLNDSVWWICHKTINSRQYYHSRLYLFISTRLYCTWVCNTILRTTRMTTYRIFEYSAECKKNRKNSNGNHPQLVHFR